MFGTENGKEYCNKFECIKNGSLDQTCFEIFGMIHVFYDILSDPLLFTTWRLKINEPDIRREGSKTLFEERS